MEEMVFMFNEQKVRTVEKDGEPWFVAKDVAKILGYAETNRMTERLDADECAKTQSTDSVGRRTELTIIDESGLYNAIIGSNKPDAKKFKKWVTGEVLPAIRKHGGYLTPAKVEEALLNPDVMIRLATELKDERARRIEAERTKAQIGSRREATAMNTAAQALRELAEIKNEIGMGKVWKRVTCIPWLTKYFLLNGTAYSMIGRYLSSLSREMGYGTRKAPDERFGEVKTYHQDVIDEFHTRIKNDIGYNLLTLYRKHLTCAEAGE